MTVTFRDRGANRLLAVAKQISNVIVGVIGDAAAQKATDGGGATVGDVATAHEFGLGNVPMRSFIRAPIDAHAAELRTDVRSAAEAVIKGRLTPQQAADRLGFKAVGLVKRAVTAGIPPALSARYLPRKLAKYPGATTPLVASAQMLGSIAHRVVPTRKGQR